MAVYDINGSPISDVINEPVNAGGVLTWETVINGYIYGAGDHHFVTSDTDRSIVYAIIPSQTYNVKSGSRRNRYTVACFSNIPGNNSVPLYCELHYGENEFSFTVPNNQNIKYAVLWCYAYAQDGDDPSVVLNQITVTGKMSTTLPNTVNFLDDALNKNIAEQSSLKEEFTLCTWNIGHFAMGQHKDTDITATDYVAKLQAFNDLILSQHADIFAVEEYSRVFANVGSTAINADDVLFGDFENKFIGEQKHYSCNAVFGNIHVRGMQQVEYECNRNAVITHTTLIEPQDYYYVRWNTVLNGRDVLCIATHLAFDTNYPDVLQQAQINELISVCEDAPYVIILADFNTSNFDAFKTAGFSMISNSGVNDGYIDNIVVKGLDIVEGYSIANSSDYSDHKVGVCKLRIPMTT